MLITGNWRSRKRVVDLDKWKTDSILEAIICEKVKKLHTDSVKTGNHLGVWNELIQFTLFLTGEKWFGFRANGFSHSLLQQINFQNQVSTYNLSVPRAASRGHFLSLQDTSLSLRNGVFLFHFQEFTESLSFLPPSFIPLPLHSWETESAVIGAGNLKNLALLHRKVGDIKTITTV